MHRIKPGTLTVETVKSNFKGTVERCVARDNAFLFTSSTKDNFTQSLSVKEILDELEISKDDYYRALSISKDEDLELHLKREPNSCFVNNYFDVGLKAWQENIDIQPVFNEHKAVAYLCQYFPKTEDQCSQAMKQAAKEAFENNMHHHDTMKTIAKAYLSN